MSPCSWNAIFKEFWDVLELEEAALAMAALRSRQTGRQARFPRTCRCCEPVIRRILSCKVGISGFSGAASCWIEQFFWMWTLTFGTVEVLYIYKKLYKALRDGKDWSSTGSLCRMSNSYRNHLLKVPFILKIERVISVVCHLLVKLECISWKLLTVPRE